MQLDNPVALNLSDIKKNIEESCRIVNRPVSDVRLVAVTKTHTWDTIKLAIDAGVGIIGENRVQEALEKLPQPWPFSTELHFIGHLQKNKAKKAVSFFDCIESVDDLELLQLIDRIAKQHGKTIDVLFEVNASGEESKQGIRTEDDLYRILEVLPDHSNVRARGLMTIGPLGGDDARTRDVFRTVRLLSRTCKDRFNLPYWGELSMGMSGYYEIAIQEGSTMVRIGTALFGGRQYEQVSQ